MHKEFSGVPISSRSQMDVPVQVVSQPSSKEIFNDEQSKVANVGQEKEGQEGRESAKAEKVRSGEIKISELEPVDFDDFMHSSIVAIPKRLPSILDIHAKDPNFRLRWVNHKADGGRMLDERKAMGFRVAKPEECVTPDGRPITNDSILFKADGRLSYHDVTCMIVPTRLLWGWYKANALESAAKVAPRRLHQDALKEANATLRQGISGESERGGRSVSELSELISVYDPATEKR